MLGLNVHLYPSPLRHEMRMERECRAIARLGVFDRVEMIGVAQPDLPTVEERDGVTFRRLQRRDLGGPSVARKVVQTLDWSRRVASYLRGEPVRCVNSHSLAMLPLGAALKTRYGARLIYDTHELETEVASSRGLVRILYKVLERAWIHRADHVVVVSDSIADWYSRAYGIPRPVVVRNVPEAQGEPPEPNPALWRDRFGIPDDHVVFIYQGILTPGRRIEQFVRVFQQARPDRHVVFMGYGALEGFVRQAAARHPAIHFAPAVPPASVLWHTAAADVGLVGVENVCLSYYYSLPNKIFEYLRASLPSFMPDYPEMRRLNQEGDCGWVVGETDADWLAAIDGVDWKSAHEKRRRVREAAMRYSWEVEQTKLRQCYIAPLSGWGD
jgi:glycosyltransferase involved in cell wall biosynthesis